MRRFLIPFLLLLCVAPVLAQHNPYSDSTRSQLYVPSADTAAFNALYNATNAQTYGAVPYVYTDLQIAINRSAIQAAINDAGAAAGEAYLPAGIFMVDTTTLSGVFRPSLYLPSSVTLRGAGPGKTVIRRRAGAGDYAHLLINQHTDVSSAGDSNITIRDLTLDGNGANNSVSTHGSQSGLTLLNVKGALVSNVVIMDIRGTDPGGGGESFAMDINQSSNVVVENCETIGNSYSMSGFSVNGSVNVSYVSCRSHSFQTAGYTLYGGRNVTYTNCFAYRNKVYAGFNDEHSGDVSYVNCISGGMATDYPTLFFGADSSLGNMHGFIVGAGAIGPTTYTGCSSTHNLGNGLQAPAGGQKSVIVNGGVWNYNGGYGIAMQDPSDTVYYAITGHPEIKGNTTYPVMFHGAQLNYPAHGGQIEWGGVANFGYLGGHVMASDPYGVVTLQSFPPSKVYTLSHGIGWYRFVSHNTYMSGSVQIYSLSDGGVFTDLAAEVSASGYTGQSQITITRNNNYNNSNIDSVRVGFDGSSNAIFDIKFKGISNPTYVTIGALGRIALQDTAIFGPTLGGLGCAMSGLTVGWTFGGPYPYVGYVGGSTTLDGDTHITGNTTGDGPASFPNMIVFQKGKASFSSSTRKAVYQPGMLDTDSPIVGWCLAAEGSLTGGNIWCSPKTDTLVVQCQTTCSNQFAYQWGR